MTDYELHEKWTQKPIAEESLVEMFTDYLSNNKRYELLGRLIPYEGYLWKIKTVSGFFEQYAEGSFFTAKSKEYQKTTLIFPFYFDNTKQLYCRTWVKAQLFILVYAERICEL